MPRNFDLEGSDQLTSVIWKLYLGIITKMPLKGSRHEPISIMSCQCFWTWGKRCQKSLGYGGLLISDYFGSRECCDGVRIYSGLHLHLKIGHPKMKLYSIPTIHFQVLLLLVSGRVYILDALRHFDLQLSHCFFTILATKINKLYE